MAGEGIPHNHRTFDDIVRAAAEKCRRLKATIVKYLPRTAAAEAEAEKRDNAVVPRLELRSYLWRVLELENCPVSIR